MDQFPDDWRIKQLNSLVKPDRPIAYGIVQTGDHIPGGVPCVRVVDLTEMVLDPARMIQTTRKISQQYRRTILRKDELMFVLRGEIGHVVKVPSQLIGANLTRGVALISPNDEVTSDYLAYAISSAFVKRHILHRLNGSTFKEIPLGKLRQVPVPVPPLPEQRKIAAILGTWDAAIGRVEQLIAALQRRKQGLMQRLLTGAVRFPEFWGAEREEKELSEVVEPVSRPESVEPGKEYRLIGVRWYLEGAHVHDTVSGDSFVSQSLSRIEENDILYNKMWVSKAAFAVAKPEHAGAYGTGEYPQFRAKAGLDARFLSYAFHVPRFQHDATSLCRGTTGRIRLHPRDFLQLKMSLPSLAEQHKIAEFFGTVDQEIALQQKRLAQLQAQKKGLMQRLLTGQVRVLHGLEMSV